MSTAPPIRKNRTFRDQRSVAERIADEAIKERVIRGLEFLKEEYGEDWVDHIDLETLDLADAQCCVLGQLGGFDEGLRVIAHKYGSRTDGGATLAFNSAASYKDDEAEYASLTVAWRAVIEADPFSEKTIRV